MQSVIIKYIVAVLITGGALFAGYKYVHSIGYRDGVQSVINDTTTVYITDTITATKPVYRFIHKTDTLIHNVDADSIYNEALAYWLALYPDMVDTNGYLLQGNYSAEMDTTIDNDDLSLKVSFVSPMPLHPSAFFNYSYSLKKYDIVPSIEQSDFWHRLGFQLGVGFCVDLGGNRTIPTIYFGYGIKF